MNPAREPQWLTEAALLVRYTVLLIAGALLAAGLAGAGPLATCFGLFLLAAGGLSFALTYQTLRHVRLRRVLANPRAWEDALAVQTVKLHSEAPWALLLLQLEDHFPAAGRERQTLSLAQPLLGGELLELPVEYRCAGKRGRYTAGPLRLVAYDPCGLFWLSVADNEAQDFFVYPPAVPLEGFPFRGLGLAATFGDHASHRSGQGEEFAGIHEYREWDRPRDIHWPATARTGRLMVKEFTHLGAVRVTLFFDLARASHCGIGRHSTTEYAIRLVASLAQEAIAAGHQVQVLAEGDRLLYQPFGGGTGHLSAILQELAAARGEGQRPLGALIDQYVDLVPPHSCAILVCSRCDLDIEAYLHALRLLRARQVHVMAILLDHTSFLPIHEVHRLEPARAARAALLQQGVTVYAVGLRDNLAAALALPVSWAEAG